MCGIRARFLIWFLSESAAVPPERAEGFIQGPDEEGQREARHEFAETEFGCGGDLLSAVEVVEPERQHERRPKNTDGRGRERMGVTKKVFLKKNFFWIFNNYLFTGKKQFDYLFLHRFKITPIKF